MAISAEENRSRQANFLQRIKAKGYVVVGSLYVPLAIRDTIRELVKAEVKRYEDSQSKF